MKSLKSKIEFFLVFAWTGAIIAGVYQESIYPGTGYIFILVFWILTIPLLLVEI